MEVELVFMDADGTAGTAAATNAHRAAGDLHPGKWPEVAAELRVLSEMES